MNTIHLQGIGKVSAKPAGELIRSDKIVFNFGYVYTVTEVSDVSACFVIVTLRDAKGAEYVRKFEKSRLVGVSA